MTCPTGTDVALAGQLLREGKLVAFATETVYGLGGNALDPRAIAGIFAAKQRPEFDPIIAHVPDVDWLPRIVSDFHPLAQQLAAAFWPGPLTLVLPKTAAVPDLLTSGLSTVAVRVPAHPLARQLIEAAGVPVGAPSANLFGSISPTTAQHVVDQLGSRIDYVLDGGACAVGLESTVVGFITPPGGKAEAVPILLRPGGVPLEELEAVVGPLQRLPNSGTADSAATANSPQPSATDPATAGGLLAPGMLPRHYAPRTGLV
ncbi:MAG: threonylcarbamoyl-AMP synthase, partial [Planctomycetaceae bacterium]|nr:threonylcarbamoyl-AMP synthase [Planctomycetaceae bacterium]